MRRDLGVVVLLSCALGAAPDAAGHDVTTCASVDSNGTAAIQDSDSATTSADGTRIAFHSWASLLVPNDTNNRNDVLLRGPEFTLEGEPPIASAGQSPTLTTFVGIAGSWASTWVVGLNGAPTFVPIANGALQSDGTFAIAGTVPSGLSGLDVTVCSYCIGDAGVLETSDDATLVFQSPRRFRAAARSATAVGWIAENQSRNGKHGRC